MSSKSGEPGAGWRGYALVAPAPVPGPDLVAASFKEITFTNDPNAASLKTAADQAVSLGLLQPVNLDGIYALDPLNKVLAAAGESQISS